jgi:DNA-binding transcriptional MerR regulator
VSTGTIRDASVGALLLTTKQVAAYAGVSVRQLDHWVRIGEVIQPSTTPWQGSGTHRLWTAEEARVVRVLGQLAAARAPLSALAAAAEVLISDVPRVGDSRWIVVDRDRAELVALKDLRRVAGTAGYWFVPLAIGAEPAA